MFLSLEMNAQGLLTGITSTNGIINRSSANSNAKSIDILLCFALQDDLFLPQT